jgi:hypothetical protein
MYPIGHIAVSYLAAKPILRNQPTFTELAALTAGTLFPAASNIALTYVNVFGVHHFWSHSPLLLVPLGILGILCLQFQGSFRRAPIFFALGIASHLIVDLLFDFPLIYFSNDVDDIGGPWFFPWQPFLIRYEEPGFEIQPWELMLEGLFLAWIVWKWRRRDLAVYGVVVAAVTVGSLILENGGI